jgi:hypothetical protein
MFKIFAMAMPAFAVFAREAMRNPKDRKATDERSRKVIGSN